MSFLWCRLWNDMPIDPKWRTIARASGQRIGDVIAVFVFLMANASANACERGRTHNWNSEDVANAIDIQPDEVDKILLAMEGRVIENGRLRGWENRQPKKEDGSAERAKEWRLQRKQKSAERSRTLANANERPDKDKDTDKDSLSLVIKEIQGSICMVSNQVELDMIGEWIESVPQEWIREAIKIAALKKVRNLKYVDSILVAWAAKFKPEEKPWEAQRGDRPDQKPKDHGKTPDGFWAGESDDDE